MIGKVKRIGGFCISPRKGAFQRCAPGDDHEFRPVTIGCFTMSVDSAEVRINVSVEATILW